MGILKRISWKIVITSLVLAACVLMPSSSQAQQDKSLRLYEQKIKAGIIYNFLKFTHWPASTFEKNGSRLEICLLGGDPFDGYLSPLQGKSAQQYKIAIIDISSIEEADNCNMVFVHRDKESLLSSLFNRLKGKPVLTVSDIENFSRRGGMVEMARENESVSLYINKEEADAAGLGIQNSILKLAKPASTKKG